jgi:hypothetical protein
MVHFFIGAKTQQHFLMTSLFFCLWNVYGTYPILQYLLKYHTLLNLLLFYMSRRVTAGDYSTS